MKKIGLTLSDKDYQIITKIAKLNEVSATTICSLIIQTRLSWYQKNEYLPKFGTYTFEQKMNKPTQQKTETTANNEPVDPEEWNEIMNRIFGDTEEKPIAKDELPF